MQSVSLEGFKSSLEVLYPVTLVMNNFSNRIQLELIHVQDDKRGKGIGREVMELIIAYAEFHQMPIELSPSGSFGSSKRKLRKFYKKLGFVKNKRRRSINHYGMIRHCLLN
ncbi:MAG: hypothetical protein HeimC2_04720 [Candidatus Heimdallarchaeota archaeon LC_2]|nr:MAG: hypothetical protein HeimC2_04720 [Candidatus Heimdallarchaeota archaeon LC_2]